MQIRDCIGSILNNSYNNFELIVTDQSSNELTKRKVINFNNRKIKYFKLKSIGKSKALNFAISKAQGNILTFTDDDCIVDRNWLTNINNSFLEYREIIGVFGKILSYKPKKNIGKICPCTFLKRRKNIITKPTTHNKHIGFGNNVAFRREIFEKIGCFKEWLGPTSIGSNAEDAEYALRALLNNYELLYNPDVKVYHNRWLTEDEFRKQQLSYACGEIACYGYFALQGKDYAKKVLLNNFLDSYHQIKKNVKDLIKLKKSAFRDTLYTLKQLLFRIRGLFVAFYYSKKDPL